MDGLDVPAGSARGLEHSDIVAAIHQFVSAAQPADARAGDDDSLRPRHATVARPGSMGSRLRTRDTRDGSGGCEPEQFATGAIVGSGVQSGLLPGFQARISFTTRPSTSVSR